MNCSVSVSFNAESNSTTSNSSNDRVTLSFLGILGVLIFVANSVVIYLYKNNRYLKTITNFCLVFLAVSDLLASLVAIPMIIICNITKQDSPCTTMDLASRFIAISTILHLMVVSTERYLMIVFPMHYMRLVSKTKIVIVLVSVWVFSFTVAMIQLSWYLKEEDPCSKPGQHDMIYSFTTFFGIIFPVLCCMVFIYSHIFKVIRRQINSIKRQNFPASSETNELMKRKQLKRGEGRAMVVFGLMLVTFVLGWFPYFILTFLRDLGISQNASSVFWLFLRFSTSLVNPLLYTFLKMDFKKALRRKRNSKMSYKSADTQNETRV